LSAPRALRPETLSHHAARVVVPTYDRVALTPAVVHMSVGSFHRSHQAMYFDEIAQRAISTDWGLVGVGLHRAEMEQVLTAQDGLYTVVARDEHGDSARVVGVISRYLFAPQDLEAVLRALADPRTRLVTLTVTSGGYTADPGGDAARPGRPAAPAGYLVEALDRRRRAGLPPFTVLSCDNMPGNGAVARAAVLATARLRDEGLAAWIEDHVTFPSSMVDRITPRTSLADRDFVEATFGVADRWPVITEPFSQWIIEDSFCNGRPPLDRVGAQFVADVRPYALMKTRLLNASHCALGYLGHLAGLRRTDEAMADPAFAGYIARMMDEEVTPLLPAVPGVDLDEYKATVLRRLANPKVGDRLLRLCRSGSTKMPYHVIGSIREARAEGRPHACLTLAVAGWLRHLQGVDERGVAVAIDDPAADRLQALAIAGGSDPRPLLAERSIFGPLGDDEAFVADLGSALRALEPDGARACVAACAAVEEVSA
jgi:fructuronate reductase/mannitol 2-dehydrogenase